MDCMRNQRVAVVYHFFPHYRAAIMQMLLASRQANYILVGDRSDPDKSIEPWLPPSDRFAFAPCVKLTSTLLWQKGLLRLAVRRDIDTIIFLANANFLSTWAAALLARLTGKRVLFWTHGWIRKESGVKSTLRNLYYFLADGLLLYGNRAKEIGVTNGFPAKCLHVIYNSLDYSTQAAIRETITTDRIIYLRKQFFSNPDLLIMISIGRLNKLKKLDLLLYAMSLLQRINIKTGFLLVGDGPERQHLEKLAMSMNLTVHFYGACYDEKLLAELIMLANVTVSPGQVGLTAMHSLVYGTPVITHDDPDNQGPEWEAIIPDQTGDFFRREDVHDLARVIQKWSALPWPNEKIRQQCVSVIEKCYNPQYQEFVINRAVLGLPAE